MSQIKFICQAPPLSFSNISRPDLNIVDPDTAMLHPSQQLDPRLCVIVSRPERERKVALEITKEER